MKKKLFVPFVGIFLVSLLGCSKNNETPRDYFVIHFNTCTDLETNVIDDQHLYKGEYVDEPVIITPMSSSSSTKASGWYTDSGYTNKWDFDYDTVEGDMTLYAKWAEVLSIYYYLEGTTSPIWTVSDACKGEPLEKHDELCDGYTFEGYFSDSDCTVPFDLDKPLYEDTTVYMKRNNIVDINPMAIKRRFVNVAAGGTGSKQGSIGEVDEDEYGNTYVDVNFGYSTSADPYIQITNPVLDISESQILKLRFKNLGGASSFSFYWVSKYANGSFAGDTSYYTGSNSIRVDLAENERNMDPDKDVWVEKTVDISSIAKNGISTWGNSTSLIKLRLQFGYVSKSEQDLSNVIRFNYIKGSPDPTHKGFIDSEIVKKMLVDDSASEIKSAQEKQTALENGMIFPKNNDFIDTHSSKTHYLKTDGVLLYSAYGKNNNKYIFDFSGRKNISADNNSYLRINLSNFSYITTLDISITTQVDTKTKITTGSFILSSRRDKASDYYINLYEMSQFSGTVYSVTLKFDFKGVDNAILLHELEFMEARAFQSVGFNFNDNDFASFKGSDDISLARNSSIKGTTFTVSKASELAMTPEYELDTSLYSSLNLSFFYPSTISGQNIANITVSIKINGIWKDYIFASIFPSSKIQNLSLPYSDGGLIEEVKIAFDNKGEITIQKITFALQEEDSFDLSSGEVYKNMLEDWREGMTYDSSLSASTLSSSSSAVRYYFGNRYAANLRKSGNISLYNKTRLYFIYQKLDTNVGDKIWFELRGLSKNSTKEYKTAVGNEILLARTNLPLEKSLNDKSWNVGYVPLDESFTSSDEWYVSQITLSFSGIKIDSPTINIRGVVIR